MSSRAPPAPSHLDVAKLLIDEGLQLSDQSWALSVFFYFFKSKQWIFAFFVKLIWLGVGFLNRSGAEIGY